MPSSGTSSGSAAALIVASYLRTSYPSILPAFLAEAGLSADALPDDLPDLRTLVEEWQAEQLARQLRVTSLTASTKAASTSTGDATSATAPLEVLLSRPLTPQRADRPGLSEVERTIHGVSAGNLLGVRVERVPKRVFDTTTAAYRASYPLSILVTAVDKSLTILDYASGEVEHILTPHRAAVLCVAVHPVRRRYLLSGSMDGSAVLTDLITLQPLQTFRHAKFVVRCAFSPDGRWMATASYDRTIVLYEAVETSSASTNGGGEEDMPLIDDEDDAELAGEPTLRYEVRHRIEIKSNPEALVFHPESRYLMYTLRGSHLLHYLSLPGPTLAGPPNTDDDAAFQHLTRSFNPHPMDTHVSFSVLHLALHPSGRLIACQTGDHAGRAGERVLIYATDPPVGAGAGADSTPIPDEQGENGRLACLWTGQEGDDFVLPRMAWLPDGSGMITTTTTGHLALLDLQGKVRSRLKAHGDGAGSQSSQVVRDVAVVDASETGEEGAWRAVSVGYDGKVCISA